MPVKKAQPKSVAVKKIVKPSSIQKVKLCRIVWRDAFSEQDQWHDSDSLETIDYLCETIGFLIEDNKKPHYITVASTITHDGYYCSIMNIPKSMIVSKVFLSN
jgi:hypothetical protein